MILPRKLVGYTYRYLEYAKFNKSDWKEFVQQQLEDSTQYIEN